MINSYVYLNKILDVVTSKYSDLYFVLLSLDCALDPKKNSRFDIKEISDKADKNEGYPIKWIDLLNLIEICLDITDLTFVCYNNKKEFLKFAKSSDIQGLPTIFHNLLKNSTIGILIEDGTLCEIQSNNEFMLNKLKKVAGKLPVHVLPNRRGPAQPLSW